MSTRSEVLLWAQRVMARKTGPAHLILEVREDATPDQVQAAFHKIARTSHPDLHRNGLTPDEHEMVTSAYAAVAGAYMTLRSQRMATRSMRPLTRAPEPVAAPPPPAPRPGSPTRTPPVGTPAARPPGPEVTGQRPVAPANLSEVMSSKAVIYYRKAEGCLGRGDLKAAILQIKLAVAADPHSTFLRSALAEVDAELRRNT